MEVSPFPVGSVSLPVTSSIVTICLSITKDSDDNCSQSVQGCDENEVNIIPRTKNGGPVRISCGFYIESISSFNDMSMSFTVDIYLRMSWTDDRLLHNSSEDLKQLHERSTQWMPDVYFINGISSKFQEVTRPNFFLLVYRNGSVAYSTRVTIDVACSLELSFYPHDTQECNLQMALYRYHTDQVLLQWFNDEAVRIQVNPSLKLPQYVASDYRAEDCSSVYTYGMTEHGAKKDTFSCLRGVVVLHRAITYHLVQTYIPTSLMVIISWVSFWIDSAAVPARVTLSFTSLLTITTQGAVLQYGVPAVSYAKAVDWWFGTCMIFVFAGLLEFALVNSLAQRAILFEAIVGGQAAVPAIKIEETRIVGLFLRLTGGRPKVFTGWAEVLKSIGAKGGRESVIKTAFDSTSEKQEAAKAMKQHYRRLRIDYATASDRVDFVSRFLFPIVFSLFTLSYIVIVTSMSTVG